MTSSAPQPFEPRRILACVSEGTHSDDALRAAVDLANSLGAKLDLLHAVPHEELLVTKFASSQVAAMTAERVTEARRMILAHWSHAQQGLKVGETPIEDLLEVRAGVPAQLVLEHAREHSVDLVVLGDNGKRHNLDFGGVARAVFAKSPCPVWLQPAAPQPIKRILVPVDLSDFSYAALSIAIDLAKKLGARVTALHAYQLLQLAYAAGPFGAHDVSIPAGNIARDAAKKHFEEAMAEVDWKGVEHDVVFIEDDPSRAVLERGDETDLVVMGTHGRTGLAAALLGGVAYHVLRNSKKPVLTIRQPKHAWIL